MDLEGLEEKLLDEFGCSTLTELEKYLSDESYASRVAEITIEYLKEYDEPVPIEELDDDDIVMPFNDDDD